MRPLKHLAGFDAHPPLAPLTDTFAEDHRPGTVIGTRTEGGVERLGCDVERCIAIDHGALRFQPLITPGWGRQGVAYGPFRRQDGLVVAVAITNGHNTSQGTRLPDSIAQRLRRWLLGPGIDPWPARVKALVLGPRRKRLLRRFIWWLRSSRRFYMLPDFNDNLAVGWFTGPTPKDPLRDGCCFVVRAAEGDNGELRTRVAGGCLSAFRQLQNLRVYYVVALRERGAIYYAAALDDAHALPALPRLRPIAIDPFNDDNALYAGIHQCVLGQIGFRVDTRVHSVQIEKISEFASLGTAQAGDRLCGEGILEGQAERGGSWRSFEGTLIRTLRGAKAAGPSEAIALVVPAASSGLVHAVIETSDRPAEAGLVWRATGAGDHWAVMASEQGCRLERVQNGIATVVAKNEECRLRQNSEHSLQILDTGSELACYLDGRRLFEKRIDRSCGDAPGVGIRLAPGDTCLRAFEAHAREVPLPDRIAFAPSWARVGCDVKLADDFSGQCADLDGRSLPAGKGRWERTLGRGVLSLENASCAKVRAAVDNPNPGRTFYTVPWKDGRFADLEIVITPPGTGRGEGQNCRGGLVFWQDQDNYLSFTAYLDDAYNGASVAVFTKRHGFEELYDAVWTMVADKITWGRPFRLRVTFDGDNFFILLDGEPILQRALKDLYPEDQALRITRVGLAVNWEWGDDTGSSFGNFRARA
jgi:hypothetical protein